MRLHLPRRAGCRLVPVLLAGLAPGLLARATSPAPPAEPRYRLEHLTGLDGAVVRGVNSAHQAVFSILDGSSNQDRPFFWQHGKPQALIATGTASRAAFAISDRGDVAGYATFNEPAGRLAIWRAGKPTYVRLPAGNTYVLPAAMNRRGEIVGGIDAPHTDQLQGFHYRSGKFKRLPALPSAIGSRPWDINEQGQIAGTVYRAGAPQPVGHAVTWIAGEIRELRTLGGKESNATTINERGQIAGVSLTASGEEHACLWERNRVTDLGTPGQGPTVSSLNNRGQVVGSVGLLEGQKAILWQHGRAYHLNRLVPADTGWTLLWARHIDDRGRIFCLASRGTKGGYVLLTPQ